MRFLHNVSSCSGIYNNNTTITTSTATTTTAMTTIITHDEQHVTDIQNKV